MKQKSPLQGRVSREESLTPTSNPSPAYCFLCGVALTERHHSGDSVCDRCYKTEWKEANELAGLFYEGPVPLEERRQRYHACKRYHWRTGAKLERSLLCVLGYDHAIYDLDLPDFDLYRIDWVNVDWSQAHKWSNTYWHTVWNMERDYSSFGYRYYLLNAPLQEQHVQVIDQVVARKRIVAWQILPLPWEETRHGDRENVADNTTFS